MHLAAPRLHRPADLECSRAGIIRVDAALHADFGRAARARLAHARRDLVEREIVWPAAQVFAGLALREGAELAPEVADVGVVDVARDDVADDVAVDDLGRSSSAARHTAAELGAARPEESNDLAFVERALPRCALARTRAELAIARPKAAPRQSARSRARRQIACTRHTNRRARPAARHRSVEHGLAQSRIKPVSGSSCIGRIDRKPLDEFLAGRFCVARARTRRCGHGASGLTWSGVTGDTPPQSLMPAAISGRSASGA